MDLTERNITNLTEYTSLSRDVMAKHSQLKIKLNISTIVTLIKFKSLEVEYFEKYYKNGAAFLILESMLQIPSTITWDDLSKKLLSLLKFWFNKLQQQIMQHNSAWWNFLQQLLYFVKELRTKGPLTNCKLVELLGEDFLELTINGKLDLNQRYATLQCFNICCSDLSRESRLVLRKKFEEYFPKLAHMMPSWGDFRLQFSTMETLLRWLLSRKELSVRKEVATLWFPQHLYSKTALRIFLDRDWKNFFKDARDFLNAQNENNSSVISLICKKIHFGNTEVITATDKKYWLDFNIDTKCISLMLELRLLELLKISNAYFDALVVSEDNTRTVKLIRNAGLIKIEITLKEPLNQHSEVIKHERELAIYMNAINSDKVNESLKKIFENKYENSLDSARIPFSQNAAGDCSQIEDSEDSRQFTINTGRRKQSRVVAASLKSHAWKSPSTTSTTSLLLLKEKLSEYPGCLRVGNEEYSGICAQPLLPRVTEESEENIRLATPRLNTRCDAAFSGHLNVQEAAAKTAASKGSSISLVLATTIDSYEAIVPYDTLDGFPEDLELNTLNYMAYQHQNKSEGAPDIQSEVIENTPLARPGTPAQERAADVEADVGQCVNELVDHVCEHGEIISKLSNQDEFTKKLLIEAGLQTNSLAMDQPASNKKTKKKKSTPIQITFPKTKKKGNKRKGQKNPESDAVGKLSISYETDENFKSPNRKIQKPNTRRRRKLYSPKDELHAEGAVVLETDEDRTRTPTTSKTPYRDIQQMQATHRESAKRKTIPEKVRLSPRSKRLNDDFDKLLQSHCDDVNVKKSNNKKDISIYKFTDSDDSEFELSEIKKRKRKQKKINMNRDRLIDEKMRNTAADLNTSLVVEEYMEVCENLEPVVIVTPVIDLPEGESNSAKKIKSARGRPTQKNAKPKNGSKKGRPAKRQNSKQPPTDVINLIGEREESLSPGLKCEVQVAEKRLNDSISDLEKINILEKATNTSSEHCVDFERIQTTAAIEHVPLAKAPPQITGKAHGQVSQGELQSLDVTPTIENNNLMAKTSNDNIADDRSNQRFPRVSIERMSEEDINKYAPRANSVFGSSLSGDSSPKPRSNNKPLLVDRSAFLSPQCETPKNNKQQKRNSSMILPLNVSKISKNSDKRNTPQVEIEERFAEKERKTPSIKAVSLKAGKSLKVQTPKLHYKRVLKTPDSKENSIQDAKRPAEMSRSLSSSDSGKRRITRRAAKVPATRDSSSSAEIDNASTNEAIQNWLDESSRNTEDVQDAVSASVKVNIFGDIFKAVQHKIDEHLATINDDARESLEHIQKGMAKHIEAARLRRQALYRETARQIFSEIGRTLDEKFTQLEEKCEGLDDQILENVSRDSTQMLAELATRQVRLTSFLERTESP